MHLSSLCLHSFTKKNRILPPNPFNGSALVCLHIRKIGEHFSPASRYLGEKLGSSFQLPTTSNFKVADGLTMHAFNWTESIGDFNLGGC